MVANVDIVEPFVRDPETGVDFIQKRSSESSSPATNNSWMFLFLSDVISFLLQHHTQHAFGTRKDGNPMELEVVLFATSPGGPVSLYGLMASQVQRLRNILHLKLTVCVDKLAASGGHMIASQADTLLAAPFATIGSIGVMMDTLTFYELAKRHGVQPVSIKAGKHTNSNVYVCTRFQEGY